MTSLTDRLHAYSGQTLVLLPLSNAVYRFFFTKRRWWITSLSVSISGRFQWFQTDLLAHTRKPLYTLFLNHILQNLQIRELCRLGISYINCYTLFTVKSHTWTYLYKLLSGISDRIVCCFFSKVLNYLPVLFVFIKLLISLIITRIVMVQIYSVSSSFPEISVRSINSPTT